MLVSVDHSTKGITVNGSRHARDNCNHTPAKSGLPAPTAWPTNVPRTLPCMKTPVEDVHKSATATALRYRVPFSSRWPSREVSRDL